MATVDVLIEGYAEKKRRVVRASSSSVLVHGGGVTAIFDPGCNAPLLLRRLRERKREPADIHYIILSHFHPDHALNAALFPRAKILDAEIAWNGDREYPHNKTVPGTHWRILATPGHAAEHAALLVPTRAGTVALAGDNFWWFAHEKQRVDVNKPDPYALDHHALVKSRQKLLRLADQIVPGHGKPFPARV